MRNKTKLTFLSIILSAALVSVACQKPNSSVEPSSQNDSNTSLISSSDSSTEGVSSSQQSSEPSSSVPFSSSSDIPSSSVDSSSSSVVDNVYTVTFKVDGVVVQTSEVKEGELVTYNGEEPTKAGDANAPQYRFVGWDRDLSEPITGNTVINAIFSAYASEIVIDDFESYEISAEMIDEGWTALTYKNNGWSSETSAAVSLSTNATGGEKALRFDAWANQTDYKFAKIFKANEFTKSANALQFDLKLPTYINKVKVLLHATVKIAGTVQAAYFSYTLNPIPSGEYISYTIPLADDGWALWNEEGKSIKVMAESMGINEDDLLNYLTRIEFYVNGNDSGIGGNGWQYIAFCDELKFVTLTNPTYSAIESIKLYDTYTGYLADNHIVRIDINEDKSATAKVIDLEEPQVIPGNVSIDDKVITFTSADSGATLKYVGRLTDGGKTIKFISSDGSLKNAVDEMRLGAVQAVDNFEQYETDGVAYYQGQTDINARSGCRGAYYAEYYSGSGSTEWGGNGWSLLGGYGDQLKLKSDGFGHNGSSKYLCLKNSKENAIRYMQWGLYDGTSEQNSFRGSKFSFWARTNGIVPAVKASLYWQTSPKNATKDSRVATQTFAHATSVGEWTHYEIDLNPNLEYYGYLIFMEKNLSADSYLYIDDVEVYTADPYAHYEVPAPVALPSVLPGTTYQTAISGVVNTHLSFEANNVAYLFFGGYMFDGEGTYEINDREVACNFNKGEVVYTATMSDDASELIYKSVSGTETQYVNALKNANFTIMDYLETSETYDSDGVMYYQGNMNESTASGARGAYYCDYQAGNASYSSPLGGSGWILMGGSGDQLKLNTTSAYYGNKTLQMKKSSAGAMRYIQWDLYKGTAKPHTNKDKFTIILNNNCDSETKVRVMVFTEQHLTRENFESSYVYKDITMSDHLMIQAEIPLSINETYYGYGIMFEKDTKAAYIDVDNAMFSCSYLNEVNYSAPKGLVLHGEGSLSDVTIKFDALGIALVTFPSLGLNEKACPYSTRFNYNDQEMIIIINGYQIKGNFLADLEGNVSLMITSVASELSTYLDAGQTFTNQPQP